MLNPDMVARLRTAVEANPSLADFEGYCLARHDVTLDGSVSDKIHLSEPAYEGSMYAPEAIFGLPMDPSCMNGIQAGLLDVPEKKLHVISDATIIGNNVVLGADGGIFDPNSVTTPSELQTFEKKNKSNHQGFALAQREHHLTAYYVARRVPDLIDKSVLFWHNLEPGNYGSFIFRQLPQILFGLKNGLKVDAYVVPDRTSWLREIIGLCQLPDLPIYTVREISGDVIQKVYMCNEFDAEGFMSESTTRQLRELAIQVPELSNGRERMANLRDRLAGRYTSSFPERIYVSRRLSAVARPSYRTLLNETEIEERFVKAGFSVVHPEILSLGEQIGLFREARLIAGPSGSGMLNAVFAGKNARVLDIESFHYTVRQHAKIYASTEKQYSFLFGVSAPGDDKPLHIRNWEVPLDRVGPAIDWLLG